MNRKQDLDWLAFRYVAAEMAEDEIRVFELRMSEDQAVREAVASAYELTRCVLAAEADSGRAQRVTSPTSRAWRAMAARIAGWPGGVAGVLLGVAACWGLVMMMWGFPRPETGIQPVHHSPWDPTVASQLAVIWSENHLPLDDPLWPPEQLDETTEDLPVARADLMTDDDSDGLWIEAAVFGLAGDAVSAEPKDPLDGAL